MRYLALLVAASAFGQTFTSVTWTSSTPTTIEATYLATGNISPYAKWGTSTPSNTYNPNITDAGTEGALINNLAVSRYDIRGLEPNTTYQVQLCFNPGVEVCSTQTAVTTLSQGRTPTVPTLPTVPLTPPTVTGTSRTVSGACLDTTNNFRLQKLIEDSSCGDEIVIPTTVTDCHGTFTINKACTGGTGGTYLIFRGGGATIDLPPPGTRVHQATVDLNAESVTLDTSRESSLATVYAAGLDIAFGNPTIGTNCGTAAGSYQGFLLDGPTWDRLARCRPNGAGVAVTGYTSGPLVLTTASAHGITAGQGFCVSGAAGANLNDCYTATSTTTTTITVSGITATGTLGGSPIVRPLTWQSVTPTIFPTTRPPVGVDCGTLGAWAQYTGTGAATNWRDNAYLCTADGWIHVTLTISDPRAGFTITSTSKGIYMYGLRVRSVAHPRDEPNTLKTGTGAAGSSQEWIIQTQNGSSDVVLDRMYIDGNAANGARAAGVQLNSNNSAVINSSLINLARWQISNGSNPTYNGVKSPNYQSGGVFPTCGAGILVQNNVVEAYGIHFHADDQCPNGFLDSQNYTLRRNLFYMRDSYRSGSPTTDGYDYGNRQMNEFKNGASILIEANDYIGGWTSVTASTNAITTSAYNTSFAQNNSATCVSNVCTLAVPAGFNAATYPIGRTLGVGTSLTPTQICTVTAATSTTISCSPALADGTWYFIQNSKRGNQDMTIRHNRHSGMPSFFNGMGSIIFPRFMPTPSGRWEIANNLIYRMNAQKKSAGVGALAANAYAIAIQKGAWWATVTNNTGYLAIPDGTTDTSAYFMLANGASDGFPALRSHQPIFSGNIMPYIGAGIRRTPSDNGTAALDAEYSASGWTWGSHLWMGQGTPIVGFPASDYWTASTPVTATGALPAGSIYGPAGASRDSSGVGMGADLQKIADARGEIETAVAVATGSGIEIRWLSSASSCVAEYRTGGAGAYTRASPTVTGRSQVVAVTGTGSYDYRVICPLDQRTGTIVR